MIRLYAIAALSLALCGGVVAFSYQRAALTQAKTELALCVAYKERTNDLRNTVSNLPTLAADILDRLRDAANGG